MEYFSMFSGIGGFEKGIEDAERDYRCNLQEGKESGIRSVGADTACGEVREFTCIGYSEIDKYASAIYRYHYPEHINYGDCRTIDPIRLPDFDLIVGGFPCQSFSIAGKRGGFEDTRGTLFFEIARIARIKRPGYLWLENVKGLLGHDEGNTFATIITILDELGYDCQWQVLNSKNHGVPQNRERVFIIGNLRGQRRPKVFPLGETTQLSNELRTETQGEREWIWNEDNQCARHLRIGGSGVQDNLVTATVNSRYGKDGSDCLINLTPENRLSRRVYSSAGQSPSLQTPSGGHHLPQIMVNLHEKRTGEWGNGEKQEGEARFTLDSASGRNLTIMNKSSIRRLTPIECERLQGFPDNWTKYGIDEKGKQIEISDTQRYKCCGNAVTTNVIRDTGKHLMQAVLEKNEVF